MAVRPIVCEWDGSSIYPGPSRNADSWRRLLPEVGGLADPIVFNRRLGEVIPVALTACVSATLAAGEVPLLLGGDHRLSYSALHAAVHQAGPLAVHLFDAHHDAHASQTLNNFSVFDFAAARLPIDVVRHGVREEPGPARDHPPVAEPAAAYVTVDVDYLDPAHFAAVSHPLPVPEGATCDVPTLLATVADVAAETPIVGLDVVEWCADRATDAEHDTVLSLLRGLVELAAPAAARNA